MKLDHSFSKLLMYIEKQRIYRFIYIKQLLSKTNHPVLKMRNIGS